MLKEGDVFELVDGDRVYTSLPWHLLPTNHVSPNQDMDIFSGNFEIRTSVEVVAGQQLRNGGTADYLIGKYVVTKTSMTGGGFGHGPNDVYPDGHRVWAQHSARPRVTINFYQSGAFTCVLPEKAAIGRATAIWAIEPASTSTT